MTVLDARTQRILARIRRIPRGRVQTYGDIDREAPRMVGRVLSTMDVEVPWHRVVRADGTLPVGERQRQLLAAEGVPLKGERVDMRAARGPYLSDGRGTSPAGRARRPARPRETPPR